MSTCVVYTFNERYEIRKRIQDVDSVFLLAVAVKLAYGITLIPSSYFSHATPLNRCQH